MNALPYRITDTFVNRRTPDSPAVGDRPGLRLVATDVNHVAGALSFTLRVAFGFPDAYWLAFADVQKSIVIELQDAETGRAAAFPLLDPTINYTDLPLANFTPPREAAPSVAFMRGWVSLPLEVPWPDPARPLYARAALHGTLSETVRVAAGVP